MDWLELVFLGSAAHLRSHSRCTAQGSMILGIQCVIIQRTKHFHRSPARYPGYGPSSFSASSEIIVTHHNPLEARGTAKRRTEMRIGLTGLSTFAAQRHGHWSGNVFYKTVFQRGNKRHDTDPSLCISNNLKRLGRQVH